MATYLIRHTPRLSGEVEVSTAKNAVLPILAAGLLTEDPLIIKEVPRITDVETLVSILRDCGAEVNRSGADLSVCALQPQSPQNEERMRKLRASILILGPILARTGSACVGLPGGCAIGQRPIDLHLKGLQALGAQVHPLGGMRQLSGRLTGARIYLDLPSVGATENAMLAALGADGCTTIENAACEPEIADLGAFLCACGADLRGAGTPTSEIEGGKALHGATYTILPDRIETATYLCACAACGGALTLRRAAPASCAGVIEALGQCGCRIRCGYDTIAIHRQGPLTACRAVTARPYPGFPTDAMPVLLAAQLGAQGKTSFTETIFENRFLYVQELQKLGAKLSQDGRTVRLQGAEPLHAARLHAGDLRGGAALVLGAMQAEGESTIFGVKHIQRGYDNLEAALQSAGARLKTVEIPIKV